MALRKCPCAFRLRRLAQNVCRGIRVRHFSCKLTHKMVLRKCPCAFRLRRLAQNVCRGIGVWHFSPQNCVGFLILDLYLPPPLPPPRPTIIFVTHHLCHPFFHTQLCLTPSLSHQLSHTIFHRHLCNTPSLSHTIFHTQSFTYNFVTHHLSDTSLSHTIFQTPSFTHTHTYT